MATTTKTARSTYKVELWYSTGSAYEKLVGIKGIPDLGGAPEMLETTTTSDAMQTYIKGIQSADALEFTCNYNATDFQKIQALGKTDFAIVMGDETGSVVDGCFTFSGEPSVFVASADVNAVVDMTVTIAPSTEITFATKLPNVGA